MCDALTKINETNIKSLVFFWYLCRKFSLTMEDRLNSYLFKNAADSIKQLTLAIREKIKGTQFEGKVFMAGGTVRNLILGVPNDGTYEIVVEKMGGGVIFASWLTKQINKKHTKDNPSINEEWGLGCFSLDLGDVISDITIEASQTMKMWPESTKTPINQLYGTLLEDALSRDFTINALYYDISDDRIIDKTGQGLFDIAMKILRTPKNAGYVFRCSPIRLLRGLRLSANHDFAFSKDTWLGMVQKASLVTNCDKIDIRRELKMILLSDKPSTTLNRMDKCGIMKYLFEDVHSLKDVTESYVDKTSFLDHTFSVVDSVFPMLENRLAALLHDIGMVVTTIRKQDVDDFSAECACDILAELGYKQKTIAKVSTAIQNHRFFSQYSGNVIPNAKRVKMFLDLCGEEYPLVLDLMNAENNRSKLDPKPRQVLNILKKIETMQKVKEEDEKKTELPINGDDVMTSLNLKKGPMVGYILKKVKREFEREAISTKDECLAFAKVMYDKYKDKF